MHMNLLKKVTMFNIKKMPKVELHLHLDGSVRLKTASQLTHMPLKKIKKLMIAKEKCNNLNEYLTKFALPISLMQSKENLIRIAQELVLDLKKENVIYAEVRFAPLLHLNSGLTGEEVIDAVLLGLNDKKIKVNLILCMMRNFTFEENLKTIELADKYLNNGVVALDLAGAENIYKNELFSQLFTIIKNKNIPFTIHAGEASDAMSVLSAISFKPQRIGHGVRSVENEEILKLIKNKNIPLEICPTSNIQTNIYKKYQYHPLKKLYDFGIKITINTDNRTVSNINLSKEYKKIIKYFNFKLEDFQKITVNAINSAFISAIEKDKYLKIISNYFANQK